MLNTPFRVDDIWSQAEPCPFDAVIDVRSPGEFAEDQIPDAINLPVLSDTERAEVGTLYRQVSPFAARRAGAALVSANISHHITHYFSQQPKSFRPLIYCWRGGQRSASLALVLAQVGWRVAVLSGGYKTYRAHVIRELLARLPKFQFRLISGATGCGKTALIKHLAARKAQVLDLEELAHHRGSALGAMGPQPTQKGFESALLAAVEQLNTSQPVWVEAESHRIGNVHLPATLWNGMRAASGIELVVPLEQRLNYLLGGYTHLIEEPAMLLQALPWLTPRHGARRAAEWARLVEAQDWTQFVSDVLKVHYDPGYARSAALSFPNVTMQIHLAEITSLTLDELATRLVQSTEFTEAE